MAAPDAMNMLEAEEKRRQEQKKRQKIDLVKVMAKKQAGRPREKEGERKRKKIP